MLKSALYFAACLVAALGSATGYSKEQVPVLVANDVYKQYQRFKEKTKHNSVTGSKEFPQGRDLVDIIVLEKALTLGGCNCELEFHTNSIYGRNIELILSGKYVMSADTLWLQDIEKHKELLLTTDAVIKRGEYDVGLYTSPNNKKALSATTLDDINKLSAVSNTFWSADWQTMRELAPYKLAHIESWPNLVKLVETEVADFTLLHFRINETEQAKLNLVPIENVKAILWDSRHFALNKQHPLALKIKEALDKGLAKLSATGELAAAYQNIGINNPAKRNWKILNPHTL